MINLDDALLLLFQESLSLKSWLADANAVIIFCCYLTKQETSIFVNYD